eukprot:jgi/Chrpa1/1281/Chrysochromulina_OHIO_Genome00011298-RA
MRARSGATAADWRDAIAESLRSQTREYVVQFIKQRLKEAENKIYDLAQKMEEDVWTSSRSKDDYTERIKKRLGRLDKSMQTSGHSGRSTASSTSPSGMANGSAQPSAPSPTAASLTPPPLLSVGTPSTNSPSPPSPSPTGPPQPGEPQPPPPPIAQRERSPATKLPSPLAPSPFRSIAAGSSMADFVAASTPSKRVPWTSASASASAFASASAAASDASLAKQLLAKAMEPPVRAVRPPLPFELLAPAMAPAPPRLMPPTDRPASTAAQYWQLVARLRDLQAEQPPNLRLSRFLDVLLRKQREATGSGAAGGGSASGAAGSSGAAGGSGAGSGASTGPSTSGAGGGAPRELGRHADEVRLKQKASHLVESISEYLQRLHEPAPPHSAREGGAESLAGDKKGVADLVRLSDLHQEIMRALHAIRDARQPRSPAAEPPPAHDGALGKLSSLKRTRARVASAGRPPTDVQPMQQQLARALVNVPAHSARRQPFSAALARLATGVTCTESAAQGAQPVPVPAPIPLLGPVGLPVAFDASPGEARGIAAGWQASWELEWSLEWAASDDQPSAQVGDGGAGTAPVLVRDAITLVKAEGGDAACAPAGMLSPAGGDAACAPPNKRPRLRSVSPPPPSWSREVQSGEVARGGVARAAADPIAAWAALGETSRRELRSLLHSFGWRACALEREETLDTALPIRQGALETARGRGETSMAESSLDRAREASAWQRVALWSPGSHDGGLPALVVAIPPKYPDAPATASVAGGGIELMGDEGAVPSVPLEEAVTRLHGAPIASPQPTSITALCCAWRHAGTRRLRCTGTWQ